MTDLEQRIKEMVAVHQRKVWGKAFDRGVVDIVAVEREEMIREAMAAALDWAKRDCLTRHCNCGPEPFNLAADWFAAEAARLREAK